MAGLRQRPPMSARELGWLPDRLAQVRANAEEGLTRPYRGIATAHGVVPDLYRLAPTGVPTAPLVDAALAYLDALDPEQRAATSFPIDSDAWRRWSNIHPFLMRHGQCLEQLDEHQRELALGLVAATTSTEGFTTARNVMRLNDRLLELTGSEPEYGEWLYWMSIFGEPSAEGPWGFQIDGHHLILNAFVLGDQLVMTPLFLGSEPVYADGGRHLGARVFSVEEEKALRLAQTLKPDQLDVARVSAETPSEIYTAAYRDNEELDYAGIPAGDLDDAQRAALVDLAAWHVGRIRHGHAEVKMAEVERHLDETYFAWMGGSDDDSVFYYRVHSPVLLIEFDHLPGIAFDNDEPTRNHIHTVVRTPNGNDYGIDLLRRHHELAHGG